MPLTSLAVHAPSDTNTPLDTGDVDGDLNTTEALPLCLGNAATYVELPAGWIYCNATAGTQTVWDAVTPDCGTEVSNVAATAVTFSIVAENPATRDIITCTPEACVTSLDAANPAD